MNPILADETLANLPAHQGSPLESWGRTAESFHHKIIVLDDDPTGVQTVNHVPVYTDWEPSTIESVFDDSSQLVFILTNSRSFSAAKTEEEHRKIANRIAAASQKRDTPYLLISRGDSTLRGHYPLETDVLRKTLEEAHSYSIDGEIIMPFFEQGGRWTIGNIHYVKQENDLLPVGETEFANDASFSFSASDLTEYVEEKTNGAVSKSDVITISIEELRTGPTQSTTDKLMNASDFQKIIVNAVSEEDVAAFNLALVQALQQGKHYLFRTGASFTKLIGSIPSQALLTREDVRPEESDAGGLVIVGSHVRKTSEQLEALMQLDQPEFIEFDCHLVFDEKAFAEEQTRIRTLAEQAVAGGKTAVIYTRRELVTIPDDDPDQALAVSVKIANALTDVVTDFSERPAFIIAKGGITSSDIGTRGLSVKKAMVAGQIAPGIPVWTTGRESKYAGLPYIIFPGNVGSQDTLKEIISELL